MNIQYVTWEFGLSRNRPDPSEEEQEAEKKRLMNHRRRKFCLFRSLSDDVLLVFSHDVTHADIARRFVQLERGDFVGAGSIFRDGRVEFESMSCRDAFGRDRPSEEGVEQRIADALKEDGFLGA